MTVRSATLQDKTTVLELLDEFRVDCIEQVTGKPGESHTARTGGSRIYDSLLARKDYCIFLLINTDSKPVGVITGYLCPMLRSGEMRAEVEEFFVKQEYRGSNNGQRTINVSFFQIFLKTWDKVRSSRRVISIGLFPLNSLNMPLQSVNFVNLLFST